MCYEMPACPRRKMEVGVNYPWPWNAYGLYFGGDPPGNPMWDVWPDLLERNLAYLKSTLKIRVVRIFLMCNAHNYGTIVNDTFVPPASLHPKFREHLREMLIRFSRQDMKVIPSLIDFGAFLESSRRYTIVNDPVIRRKFFQDVLEPLVVTSLPFHRQIYAWEVVNEPVWATVSRWLGGLPGGGMVSESDMRDFLQEAVQIIQGHGFLSTVGHRFYDNMMAVRGRGNVPQFHYYGWSLPMIPGGAGHDNTPVPEYSRSPPFTFVGEIGSKVPSNLITRKGHGLIWQELNGRDARDTRTRVFERLKALHRHGYHLALVWPDIEPDPPFNAADDPLKFSQDAQDGIKDYLAWCP